MELFFIILISLLISLTWIHYLKVIDVFEPEKPLHIVVTFVLGTLIPVVIYPLHMYVYHPLGITNSENPFFSFLFYVFAVGLPEELIKFIPVFIVLVFLKKAISEPLDYLKYICVSALGFAFGENVEYALDYGQQVLLARSILSVPGHMFFSSLFIYGFIEYKYNQKKFPIILKFVLLSILSHGLYDYFLDFKDNALGSILTILLFLFTVSAFITTLNNCINNSPFYSPKKAIDQEKVRKYLLLFYVILFLSALVLTFIYRNSKLAMNAYLTLMSWQGLVLYILIVRLSRYSIIPGHWNAVNPELPFARKEKMNRHDFNLFFGLLTIKGEGYNDAKISSLFEEEVRIVPLTSKGSYLNAIFEGIIEKKISRGGNTVYILKLYLDKSKANFKHYLLYAKTNGISFTPDNHPIASLNSLGHDKKPIFHEWVILKTKK